MMNTELIAHGKAAVSAAKVAAFLQVEGLVKSYAPQDVSVAPVFEAVNFDIQKGEFVCIIGHSGCGKSTILNILAGLDEATQGYVIMNGKEVVGPSLDRGVVFQSPDALDECTEKRGIWCAFTLARQNARADSCPRHEIPGHGWFEQSSAQKAA